MLASTSPSTGNGTIPTPPMSSSMSLQTPSSISSSYSMGPPSVAPAGFIMRNGQSSTCMMQQHHHQQQQQLQTSDSVMEAQSHSGVPVPIQRLQTLSGQGISMPIHSVMQQPQAQSQQHQQQYVMSQTPVQRQMVVGNDCQQPVGPPMQPVANSMLATTSTIVGSSITTTTAVPGLASPANPNLNNSSVPAGIQTTVSNANNVQYNHSVMALGNVHSQPQQPTWRQQQPAHGASMSMMPGQTPANTVSMEDVRMVQQMYASSQQRNAPSEVSY
ncbi:unnamed protein product [Protopolystoma xenopodis]|uniref:Uncharacterized protein n=1 Tax=Protopolystoma xenopodis TaxID=117903 RepID=A0A3S4ZZJ9_9PLAT|nr:unnamed protein product [Protopolystoma xenopodis]